MIKSSNEVFVAVVAAGFEAKVGCDSTAYCFFDGGACVLDGAAVALRFALATDIDFGNCEALSFASSASRPVTKGPGFQHFPAIFLLDIRGLILFVTADARVGVCVDVMMGSHFNDTANGSTRGDTGAT